MWGSPGTMLAAEVLAGGTGEGRWLELWELARLEPADEDWTALLAAAAS